VLLQRDAPLCCVIRRGGLLFFCFATAYQTRAQTRPQTCLMPFFTVFGIYDRTALRIYERTSSIPPQGSPSCR
jgi:hypothetical protein